MLFELSEFGNVAAAWAWQINCEIKPNRAIFNQQHAVGQHERFADIMRDEEGCKTFCAPNFFNEPLLFNAGERIERAERFIQRQSLRLRDERAGQGDALTLPA